MKRQFRVIVTLLALALVVPAAPIASAVGPSHPKVARVATAVSAVSAADAAASPCPWMNANLAPNKRARMLLHAMTLDDEIAMVHNSDDIWTYYGVAGHVAANPALCIPDLVLNDAGQGVGDQSINTTAFPAPIAQTASWDRAMQRRFGRHLGWEAFQKGINVQLAPGVNISRVPMNGRNWEYMGEDPFLSGQSATAEVLGLQSRHVIATLKHYAANSQETNRDTVSSDVGARALHEIYLPAFETAVKQGRAGSVMCSYNKINSVYACENPTTLTTDLKHEFGFSGFVMSDWGGVHSTAPSANAGLDMEMNATVGPYFTDALKTAVQNGDVPRSRLDDMVKRILRTMFRVGLFDHPTPAQPGAYNTNTATDGEKDFARRVAEQGTVLLKNKRHVLPLVGGGLKIALIGKNASPQGALQVYNGGGSGHIPEAGFKSDVVSPLEAMQARAAQNGDVLTYSDGSSIQDAVAAATVADVAIVFAYNVSGEATDLPSLSLDDGSGTCAGLSCTYQSSNQDELIAAVGAANARTVVVLNTAGPVLMPWVGAVKSIVEAWYPGQEDGNAITRILYGDVNPGGKLPETFPKSQADLPTTTAAQYPGVDLHAKYSEGLLVGYRWYDQKGIDPLFCFGHGLSYTSFGYRNLTVQRTSNGGATVSFTVRNTGARRGAEVPQVYVDFPDAAKEPPKQLKGYQKVQLGAGKSARVTIALDRRAFSHWSASTGWSVAPGRYRILVGSSSCDLRLSGSLGM